ncbi:MAG TPA: TonB-dependent receptor, partial [Phenylobacterium sp.]
MSSIIGSGLALSGLVLPAAAADGADEVAEIVVTGSRISRPNLESPVPVSVVDSRAIEASGQISTGEIIRQLPAAGVSTITPTNSTFATAGNGITTVNLRNLEESRTLVLVNGRRFVSGVVGAQAVDLNAIPTDLIDRIDVVTGGASSIYGSDALAGVVNIITKQNFEGLAASGQYGISDRDDDKTWKLNITAGSKFADDRGSAMISFGYDRTGSVYARNRCDQDACVDGANDFDGTPGSQSYRRTFTPVFSGTPPQGAILVGRPGAGNLTFSPQPNGSILPFVTARDGFNRQAFRILQVPSKRFSFSGQMNYQIAPMAELFSEVTYVHNKLFSDIEPTPFASAQLFDNSTPFCTATGCVNGIPLTSASIPNAVKQLVRDANPGVADSALVVGFRRRLNEVGDRGNDLDRSTFRAVSGLRGDLWKSWRYEASLNYGRTDEDQATNGEVNLANLRNALNSVVVNGQTVCADPVARAAGCVPVNVFGAGSITPEGAAYIRSASGRTSRIEQFVLNGYVTGDLIELPAGPLKAVIGGEYRREKSSDIPDALTQSGGTSGNATPPTIGKFDVSEGFVELRAPLLKGLPWVESLDLNLSGRYSDYSTVGTKTAYAASVEYRPVKSVMFRGQYSRSVRAPNISELFQPASQDFPQVQDPCRGVTRTAAGQAAFLNVRQDLATPANVLKSGVNASTVGNAIATACLSDPTVAARVARDGGLAISQFEAQSVTGFDGGSTSLNAETAKTLTLGVLFNPRDWGHWWAPLSVSFDYYNIKIRDRIAVVDEQVEVDKCYAGGFDPASPFCAQVVRFGAGNAS